MHWIREFGDVPFEWRNAPLKSKNGIYLIDTLESLGWCSNNGFGIMPISPETVVAFGKLAKEYKDWEIKFIWELSKAFVSGYNQGKHPLAKSPHELFDEV